MRTGRRFWGHSEYERGESFFGDFGSREEAIEDGRRTYGDVTFWILSGTRPAPGAFMPGSDDIMEHLRNAAADAASEAADEFPDVTDAALSELDAYLEGWAERHVKVTFWLGDGAAEEIAPS